MMAQIKKFVEGFIDRRVQQRLSSRTEDVEQKTQEARDKLSEAVNKLLGRIIEIGRKRNGGV